MTIGVKPIIHNFIFADEIWDKKYLFNRIDEAVDMIISDEYNSKQYRKFIEDNYSLNKQLIIINIFNDFFSYDSEYIDNFNFNDYQIKIGKKEKVVNELEIIECIIENKDKLVLNSIWCDKKNKTICLPYSLMKSKNINYINDIIDKVLNLEVKYINNIGGFIFDPNILKDIQENKLVYMWERAIPTLTTTPFSWKSFKRLRKPTRI